MLVPSDMMAAQSKMLYQLNKFYGERVQSRKGQIAKTLREMCKVVQDVLKEVEVQEPRFISSLAECNGRFEGLEVVSPNEFEVVLYLNQMGVFNFVDDGTLPGCAVLKLSDGRKRSMSLWVEFITASGYLSARKIRSRFQTLVAQVRTRLRTSAGRRKRPPLGHRRRERNLDLEPPQRCRRRPGRNPFALKLLKLADWLNGTRRSFRRAKTKTIVDRR